MQIAPFDMDYRWPNKSGTYELGTRFHSEMNGYRGGEFQQVSYLAFHLRPTRSVNHCM